MMNISIFKLKFQTRMFLFLKQLSKMQKNLIFCLHAVVYNKDSHKTGSGRATLTNLNQFNSVMSKNDRSPNLVLLIAVNHELDSIIKVDCHHLTLLIEVDSAPLDYLIEDRLSKLNFFRADFELLNGRISSINWASEFAIIPQGQYLPVKTSVPKKRKSLSARLREIATREREYDEERRKCLKRETKQRL